MDSTLKSLVDNMYVHTHVLTMFDGRLVNSEIAELRMTLVLPHM